MMIGRARAQAHPNLALVKYWGNRDDSLRLPANASVSINLDGLLTTTEVEWHGEDGTTDSLHLNGALQSGEALARVVRHLNALRERLHVRGRAVVHSENNFPTGTGIASSASAFAALTSAFCAAVGVAVDERTQTTLARLGSGSAARSIPSGFVEWHAGDTHEESFAESIAAPDHWDLVDVIAIVSTQHKAVGSSVGHPSAQTSPFQAARVQTAPARLVECIGALMTRDFAALAEVVERDSTLMHAVMMTSRPPLFYWLPPTLAIMAAVREWRADGLRVCTTLDAGANVHCVCVSADAEEVRNRLAVQSGVVAVRSAPIGGATHVQPLTTISD
ncbi:MAG: diphosphomevalonate decarboxylase [Chloroflexota bacterium]|nr:diphosphomevalonate decarboxylase [Chloroflexota bacterium]